MKADITGKFIIAELTGFEGMKIEQVIDLLKKGAADSIKKQVMDCYKKAQQLKSDIYGFGSYIYKYHAGRWKTIEKDWDAVFSNLALEVDIKVDIQDTGKTGKSPEMEGIR
jgi:spore germination protein KC